MIYKLTLHSPVALLFHLILLHSLRLSYLKEFLFLLSTKIHSFNWKMMYLAATTPWKFSSICLYADRGASLCGYLFILCSQSVLLLDLPTTSAASSKWCLTLDLWTSGKFMLTLYQSWCRNVCLMSSFSFGSVQYLKSVQFNSYASSQQCIAQPPTSSGWATPPPVGP